MRKIIQVLAAIGCSTVTSVFAQTNTADTSLYQQSIQNAVGIYYQAVGENAHLYNGSEYVPHPESNKNPYFESSTLQKASVCYDGTVYDNIPLTYDIYKDEVIISKYNQNFRIRLANNKINWFSVSDHLFIRVVHDSSAKTLPGTGFYDQLYNGNVKVLAKRKKKFDEKITLNGAITQFVQDDHFFIEKDAVYYPVTNKKSVLKVFKDRKKDVQKLLRKNNVKFNKNLEFATVKAAEYYDQVKN